MELASKHQVNEAKEALSKLSEKSLRGYIISIDDFYISTTDNEKEQIIKWEISKL